MNSKFSVSFKSEKMESIKKNKAIMFAAIIVIAILLVAIVALYIANPSKNFVSNRNPQLSRPKPLLNKQRL